ncbi:glucose-6-phosphate dehydrogenase assembly protein OpcA [Leptodesmis sichuanensis]|uniref:glucose-6-phosphate dehydrogenase assembly protein OpcA n=1 Tax=Leptodesmis sichuanensis TaxID=2906798 RepID=UPI001F191B8A|nr:glucose-6-phosphate dehydrogenase assembly protein OpcA [Leptodesmis sichuanensis]UIE37048.1 glucose-6-phosphate dehydrogenase assembly protein OpcA [Leptodesmis sichuanensis A121]
MTTPLVALQKPKGISLDDIEAELNAIWHSQSGVNSAATRASTFSMVVYEPEEFQQLLAVLGFYKGPIDGVFGPQTHEAIVLAQRAFRIKETGRLDKETFARLREEVAQLPPGKVKLTNADLRGFSISEAIAAQNPCRIITLCPTLGAEDAVTAQVSAYCPVHKTGSNLICSEYITLRGTKAALNQVGSMVRSLMIPDLPKFLWWKATPNPEQEIFRQLVEEANCVVMDSSYFGDVEAEFLKIQTLIDSGTYVADLNWHRLAPWQELTAAAFDPPERRVSLGEIDQITIDYEKGNAAQALMFLSWFASRLGWQPIAYTQDQDDFYEIKHITFVSPNEKEIKAEVAAIPISDPGEIVGDLVGLRLASSNPKANCATIICSETAGCMRMESGGGAQSALYTEQVTSASDQKAELLLTQQLQRWGRDVLYEESLALAVQLVHLRGR